MADPFSAGTILIEHHTHLPGSMRLERETDSSGWDAPDGARAAFEKEIHDAGWTFFFMAGEMKARVFGFDRQKTLRTALKRLITNVKLHHFNGIEITQVNSKSFWKVPYVSVSAHARHLQKSSTFSGQAVTSSI